MFFSDFTHWCHKSLELFSFFDGGGWKGEWCYYISVSIKDKKVSEFPLYPLARKLPVHFPLRRRVSKEPALCSGISCPAPVSWAALWGQALRAWDTVGNALAYILLIQVFGGVGMESTSLSAMLVILKWQNDIALTCQTWVEILCTY